MVIRECSRIEQTLLLACFAAAVVAASWMPVNGAGLWDKGYSLIVVPARFSVIQFMFDVIDQRPGVLVSYQVDERRPDAGPVLHVWNGQEWLPISLHDFRELNFVQQTPTRVILVGGTDLVPADIRDAVSWMPEMIELRDMANASMLNDLDPAMQWKRTEWKWFAKRYNMQIEDEAAAYRQSSWYDQQGPLTKGRERVITPLPASMKEDRDAMFAPVVTTRVSQIETISEDQEMDIVPANDVEEMSAAPDEPDLDGMMDEMEMEIESIPEAPVK